MILIIGLGNPGQKFQRTRHNVGFRVLDLFQKENNFPDFSLSKKFNSLISKEVLEQKKIILAKPQTFMNDSGKAVKKLISNFQFPISNLFVVHDDIDLSLGKIKIVKNRSSAGHKGVQSVINEIGTKNFIRFRIGIKPISNIQYLKSNIQVDKFVLQKFTKDEEKIINEIIKKTVEAIEAVIIKGLEKSMGEFNK